MTTISLLEDSVISDQGVSWFENGLPQAQYLKLDGSVRDFSPETTPAFAEALKTEWCALKPGTDGCDRRRDRRRLGHDASWGQSAVEECEQPPSAACAAAAAKVDYYHTEYELALAQSTYERCDDVDAYGNNKCPRRAKDGRIDTVPCGMVTVSYSAPVLLKVSGPGATMADTRGLQRLILSGVNFGPEGSLVGSVVYGTQPGYLPNNDMDRYGWNDLPQALWPSGFSFLRQCIA